MTDTGGTDPVDLDATASLEPDEVDFDQIKRHYYVVHTDINPTQIVPAGPDESVWHTAHGRG